MKNRNKKKRLKLILISLGCCCLIGAATLNAYNKKQAERAQESSQEILDSISTLLEAGNLSSSTDSSQRDEELDDLIIDSDESAGSLRAKTVSVANYEISGILDIPAINIRLAIIYEWSYPNLNVSACRFSGSPDSQMILLAHNYAGHFGKLDRLEPGDSVSYTDMDGAVYDYTVTETELWQTNQLRQIMAGDDWDLTLFTCTYSGTERVVIRCVRAEQYE